MIYHEIDGERVSALGMGTMRLPVRGLLKSVDRAAATRVVDAALEAGVNYFDTAYFYHRGQSEDFTGAALNRHPRESWHVATKYFLPGFPNYRKVFAKQLGKLGVDYVDFYLMHSLREPYFSRYLKGGAIDWLAGQKREGTIRHLGFSSHMRPENLARVVEWRAWDFAQIQLNYYDWNYGTARQEYEILRDHGIPIVVMEPLRGGKLAKLPDAAMAQLRAVHPEWSAAEWGLRWLRRLPGVQVVLSGMGTEAQMADNTRTFSEGEPLTDAEEAVLFASCGAVHELMAAPCTACGYCTKNCPKNLDIPGMMDVYNAWRATGELGPVREAAQRKDGFVQCVGCSACRPQCPQHIEIPQLMNELKQAVR